MRHERVDLGLGAELELYIQLPSAALGCSGARPAVLICPGGGYAAVSDREAEPVALAMAAEGFHSAVLWYPVRRGCYPDALVSLARSVAWLRDREEELRISGVHTCGFSAGGHLALCLGTFWDRPWLAELTGREAASMRPDGQLLCYPVVTGGEFAHRGSFENLLGARAGNPELLGLLSLERQVTGSTPPSFIWHTCADASVPVENSLLLASALRRNGVPFELHIYGCGGHGLSLADERTMDAGGGGIERACQGWFALAADWVRRARAGDSPGAGR